MCVKKCVIFIPKSPYDLEEHQLSPKSNPLPCLKNKARGGFSVTWWVLLLLPPAPNGVMPSVVYSTTVALVMNTGSTGTSSWKPLRPVATPLILSTTSVPSTTLPKTA